MGSNRDNCDLINMNYQMLVEGEKIVHGNSFDEVESMDECENVTIIVQNTSSENIYVQLALLNGFTIDKTRIDHNGIVNGETLIVEMRNKP